MSSGARERAVEGFDLAVVGAGLTGSEVAYAAAKGGLRVLLVTTSLDTVYMLAHSRRRLVAPTGSLLERLVQAGRLSQEIERWELHRQAKYALEALPNVHLLQSSVTAVTVTEGRVTGVSTWEGVPREAKAVVLTVGSFLGARLRQGELHEAAGRLGEMAYDDLATDLRAKGLAFVDQSLELADERDGVPYQVDFLALAPNQVDEAGRVTSLPGLYAEGVCARGAVGYEQAIELGRALGQRLVVSSSGFR